MTVLATTLTPSMTTIRKPLIATEMDTETTHRATMQMLFQTTPMNGRIQTEMVLATMQMLFRTTQPRL